MNKKFKTTMWMMLLFTTFVFNGCKKFLDEKPRRSLTVPETLADFQALLDLYPTVNSADPPSAEVSGADFYLTDADISARPAHERAMYLWLGGNIYGETSAEWNNVFRPVYFANTAIEGAEKYGNNSTEWNNLKGQAHYLRAKCFLQAASLWALAFDNSSADKDLGIPLRLSTDFNELSKRSTVRETYAQIERDLKQAIKLLSVQPLHVMRSSKPAAYGLMARTYLFMRNYKEAALYADSSLMLKRDLEDFNLLNATLAYPFVPYSKEVITFSNMTSPSSLSTSRAKVVPELLAMYADSDLRKSVYFRSNGNGTFHFRGSYNGNNALFSGVSTNEMYIISAECHARSGNVIKALEMLNGLLVMRYRKNQFVAITEANATALLEIILNERRKELPMRGLRWMDVKRLNKEGRGMVLSRTWAGTTYSLAANDPRFALPLPEDIVALTSMPQN
ncbi:MAG: RagB/SusD family nutrient uptake outer membrane protein [Chitinophagaceae bacterium]|nr:MAG: RagB/SusD family nutrient uptake outer membrane protein [Chitinophagaceae bacterium]